MDNYKVNLLYKAQQDLSEIIQFVLNVSKDDAIILKKELYDSLETLTNYPERNPVFEMVSSFPYIVRKQIVSNRYIILYSVVLDQIYIYRIIDARRGFDGIINP